MEQKNLYIKLTDISQENYVIENEPMSKHTTFKIGGNADYFVNIHSIEQLQNIVKLCGENNIPYFILGNGSNLLVSDKGIRGVVLHIGDNFSGYEFIQNVYNIENEDKQTVDKQNEDMQNKDMQNENLSVCDAADKPGTVYVRVKAGTGLGRFGNEMAANSLSGFEFAAGIPGNFGGAVLMNAGAYGGELKDIVVKVRLMDDKGNIFWLDNKDMEFGYRTSIVEKKRYIVLEAVIELKPYEKEKIYDKMKELAAKRKEKQPLEYPSAGSTFKRPEGYFAGKLISDAGLKGFQKGGAKVSEKHAGFVINAGNATADDVIELTDEVKQKVKEMSGVELELEVKKIGF